MDQMKIKSAGDFGTYAWAAELLGLSVRQVCRYVAAGILDGAQPLCGSHESARTKRMVDVDQVLALQQARKVAGRG
jgi:hypothetical protein